MEDSSISPSASISPSTEPDIDILVVDNIEITEINTLESFRFKIFTQIRPVGKIKKHRFIGHIK